MIPHWFERLSVLSLLLLAAVLRIRDLSRLPLGLSDTEMSHINISEQVRGGTVRVFFPLFPSGGTESLYQSLNGLHTFLLGDGLLGYRLLGLWSSLLMLAFLYRATRWLFGSSVALVSLGIATTNIWLLLSARTVSPVSFMPLLLAAFLFTMTRTFKLHQPIAPTLPETVWYTLLGFLIAAAVYAHYIGWLLLIILIVFVAYLWRSRQPIARQVWGTSLFAITLIMVLLLPYLISILRNPTLTSLHSLWVNGPSSPRNFVESIADTLLALFISGDTDPSRNVPSLPLLWPIWSALAVVGLSMAIRRWREPAYSLLLLMFGLGLLPDIWLRGGANFSAMILLQITLMILSGLGTYAAARYVQRSEISLNWRFVAVLVGLGFVWTLYQAQQNFLVNWPQRTDVQTIYHTDLGQIATYLDGQEDARPTLLCVNNLRPSISPEGNLRWSEPRIMGYMLHREDINLRFALCRSAFLFAEGGEALRVLFVSPRTLNEAPAAIRLWFEQMQPLDTPNLPPNTAFELTAVQALAQLGGQLQLDTSLLYPRTGMAQEPVVLPVRFGRNITLLGYHPPENRPYHPGDLLAITSYWRVDGELPNNIGIFTRLHDSPQASPFTESNAFDLRAQNLQNRDVLIQTNFMVIPPNLLPGEYVLTLGVFDNNPLNQIPVFDSQGMIPRGNYLQFEARLIVE